MTILKITLSLFLLTLLAPANISGQDFTDPLTYNNYIIAEQNAVVAKSLEYITISVHGNDPDQSEVARKAVINQVDQSLLKMKGLKELKGDNKLRNESIAVFQLYKDTYEQEFSQAVLLKKEKDSSYEAMEKYFKVQAKAEKKLSQAARRFEQAQATFATDHGIQLINDKNKEGFLTKIASVNRYSRMLFLTYFRVAKSDAEFMKALEQRKVGAMERNLKTLKQSVSESVNQLDTINGFEGHTDYLEATRDLLLFHKSLAEIDFPKLIAIFKADKEPDTESAELYNKIIRKYNSQNIKLVTAFNQENLKLLQTFIPLE